MTRFQPTRLLPLAFPILLCVPLTAQDLRFSELRRSLPVEALPGPLGADDLDGDGDVDVLVGHRIGADALWLNGGTGTFFDASSTLPESDHDTRALALGDLDGDGDVDAWMGVFDSRDEVWLNGGAADFTFSSWVFTFDTAAVELFDVDGDGDLDSVTGETSYPDVDVWLNDGAAAFSSVGTSTPQLLLGDVTDLASGDVDGDGDADLLIGRSMPFVWAGQPLENALFLNQGGGVFSDGSPALLGTIDQTHAVALHDLDLDGDLDALIGENGTDRLLRNDGSGVFTDASVGLPQEAEMTRSYAIGDVDADGDPDVVVGRYWTWPTTALVPSRLWRNDGSAAFTQDANDMPTDLARVSALALVDVDGDLDLDLLIGTETQDRLYRNDGAGAFADTTQALVNEDMISQDVEVADLDGDGFLDALVATYANLTFADHAERLYLGDGRGGFTTAPGLPAGSTAFDLDLGDLDGDGDLDVILAGGANANRLWEHTAPGQFVDVSGNLPPTAIASEFELTDADGDGDLDALGSAQDAMLLENDGAGVFTDVSLQLPLGLPFSVGVEVGDLDGDGDEDAILVASYPQQDRVLRNDGTGIYSDVGTLPAFGTQDAALGDFDLDGDLDALAGGFTYGFTGGLVPAATIRVDNDGAGGFPAAVFLGSHLTGRIAVHDLDQDGDLDAWLSVVLGPDRILENDGSGTFAGASISMPEASAAVAFGDFDGDGDVDAFAASGGGSDRVYFNLERQLAARTTPAVGKPLGFELHGPAGGAWFLGASLAEAAIATPFGVLGIAPASALLTATGSLDANGDATPAYPVPALQALVGTPVHWQALLGPPALLTHVETVVLTDL